MTASALTEKPNVVGPYLIDTVSVRFQLIEGKESGGRNIIRGIFGRVNTPTNNKRVYSEQIMSRELGRLQEDLQRRRVFGELDHPADGRTRLNRVSHIITKLEINSDKEVVGEAEIINTDAGRNLLAIIQAGGEVGVSSRGVGTTKVESNGNKQVNEDFRLMTFDVVAEPATSGAYPKFYMEGVGEVAIDELSSTDLRKHCHDAVAEIAHQSFEEGRIMALAEGTETRTQLKNELRAEFKDNLAKRLAEVKPSGATESQIKGMVEQERQKAAAMEARLEAVIAEREAMEHELDSTKDMAFKLANAYRYLQLMNGVQEDAREAVGAVVGDPKSYESLDELDSAFAEALEQVIEDMRKEADAAKRNGRLARKEQSILDKSEQVAALEHKLAQEARSRSEDASRMTEILKTIQSEMTHLRRERDGAVNYAQEAQRLSGQIQEEAQRAPQRRGRLRPRQEPGRRQARALLAEGNDYEDMDEGTLYESVRRHVRQTTSVLSEDDEVSGGGNNGTGQQICPGLNMSDILPYA